MLLNYIKKKCSLTIALRAVVNKILFREVKVLTFSFYFSVNSYCDNPNVIAQTITITICITEHTSSGLIDTFQTTGRQSVTGPNHKWVDSNYP